MESLVEAFDEADCMLAESVPNTSQPVARCTRTALPNRRSPSHRSTS